MFYYTLKYIYASSFSYFVVSFLSNLWNKRPKQKKIKKNIVLCIQIV